GNVSRADRGFEVRLLGYLDYDRRHEAFDRIDIVALGEHWGEGTFTKGARPGRSPLGIVFELSSGNAAADQVPPQGAREINECPSPTGTGEALYRAGKIRAATQGERKRFQDHCGRFRSRFAASPTGGRKLS